jgi:hypothetical protein
MDEAVLSWGVYALRRGTFASLGPFQLHGPAASQTRIEVIASTAVCLGISFILLVRLSGKDPTNVDSASKAMLDRAQEYAKFLCGQNFNQSPIICNATAGWRSPLLHMWILPPMLHALLHQAGTAFELATALFATEHKRLHAVNQDLKRAMTIDDKPRATYMARKLLNLLGTEFAHWLYELEPNDLRQPYWTAFALHALFARRLYDGQQYSSRANFCTLTYSLLSLLLFQNLA